MTGIVPEAPQQQVIAFPQRPINIIMPLEDEAYRRSLRDRAHQLAPFLWLVTEPPPATNWNDAIQDPRLQDAMAKCLATAEMCVRLVDIVNSRVGFGFGDG